MIHDDLALQYFKPSEFGEWWPLMSPRQLILLDVFRHQIGSLVHISKADGALGRKLGGESESQHNVDMWGEVRATDLFVSGVYLRTQVSSVVVRAALCGFTGIGVYADTNNNYGEPQVMFHLDTRRGVKVGQPVTWGRVAGKYTTIDNAIQHCPKKMGA